MFIELAEHLACPALHTERIHCILVPDEIVDRMVMRGTVACPSCRAEYAIADGVVRFGDPSDQDTPGSVPTASVVQALLDVSGPGGYVVLLGSAAGAAEELATLQAGVHMVTINASEVEGSGASRLCAETMIPVRNAMARGVIVGAEYATTAWLLEAARVLLRGRRLVVLDEVSMPVGVGTLAIGDGMTVGDKRG